MDKTAKIYRIVSVVILGLSIYALLLPIISPLMSKILPKLWTCPFLKITGHDCPFCGITRGVSGIYALSLGSVSIKSMVAFLFLAAESAFRLIIIMMIPGLRRKSINSIIVTDTAVHTVITVLLAIYVIMFLVTNF